LNLEKPISGDNDVLTPDGGKTARQTLFELGVAKGGRSPIGWVAVLFAATQRASLPGFAPRAFCVTLAAFFMTDTATIQADFDRIALLSGEGWDHNSHYHGFLLAHVPARCAQALDIGCGTGAFARLLAQRADHVLGLDLSPQMIRLARERSRQHPNIDFQVADVTRWVFPLAHFDCIASIATFHHLPLEETLIKARDALKVGGTLLILDLYQQRGLTDLLASALAVPVSFVLHLLKTGWLRQSPEAREAWYQHGLHEAYLPLSRMRQVCARVLPGARVRRHLLWRYSIVWKKEA
jgi:SAM-dependent methyltransferase